MYYYGFDIDKWIKRTHYLLPEEEGIYLRLINYYYDSEKPLPLDLVLLARRLNIVAYQEVMKLILGEYFTETADGYTNDKCDRNIAEYHRKAATSRLNGAKGGRPRSQDTPETTQEEPGDNPGETQRVIPGNPDPNPEEPESENLKTCKPKQDTTSENAPRSSPVPVKEIVDKWNNFARDHSLPQVAKSTKTIQGQIRQRWLDIPSLSQWDNFFSEIAANDFLAGRVPAGAGRSKPFRSTLLWITKETNFNKIASGEYN
jgi:uncharacterized protein YdaU (DUF1376 family)